MSPAASGSLPRQLESLFDGGSNAGLTDRQLLERYTADGRSPMGDGAFAALVARHGPMVLGVCRQFLGDHRLAEDAFQAVFFVLAQRAGSIRDPGLLSAWLYGIAIRASRTARGRMARMRQAEENAAVPDEQSRGFLSPAQAAEACEQAEERPSQTFAKLVARQFRRRSCCAISRD